MLEPWSKYFLPPGHQQHTVTISEVSTHTLNIWKHTKPQPQVFSPSSNPVKPLYPLQESCFQPSTHTTPTHPSRKHPPCPRLLSLSHIIALCNFYTSGWFIQLSEMFLVYVCVCNDKHVCNTLPNSQGMTSSLKVSWLLVAHQPT